MAKTFLLDSVGKNIESKETSYDYKWYFSDNYEENLCTKVTVILKYFP